MEEIQNWLDYGAKYQEGVLLYASQPGCNKVLLRNFQKKETPLLHEKLRYELKKMLSTPKPTPKKTENVQHIAQPKTITQAVDDQIKVSEKKQAIMFHQLPEELRPVLLEANTCFREMCLLKVQLNALPAHAEKEALEIQIQINSKQKRNKNLWAEIDYYQKHKVLMQKKKEALELLTPAQMVYKQQLLFAAISKLEKRFALNSEKIKTDVSFEKKNKIEREMQRQEQNLINKKQQLEKLKSLIDGKE